MFSRLREPFGKAGLIVAIVALLAATVGGAYAANKQRNHKKGQAGLNKKQKKQVRNIAKAQAKSYANSNPGPAGPQGPAGNDGQNGANGSNGSDGKDGADGTSATATAYTGAECAEASGEGGVKVSTASGDNYVCNGKEGSFDAAGFTQTGAWNYPSTSSGESLNVFMGFAIPLESPAEAHYIAANGKELVFNDSPFELNEVSPAHCLGTAEEPAADPGHFCVYTAFQVGSIGTLASDVFVHSGSFVDPGNGSTPNGLAVSSETGVAGAYMLVGRQSGTIQAWGTWAVTGE